MVEHPHRARYDALADKKRMWWIAPGKRESYTARFEGTFAEALARAADSSAFWKSSVGIYTDMTMQPIGPKGERPAPIDYMGPLWATVSVPKDSPLRGGAEHRPLSGTYSNPGLSIKPCNRHARAMLARLLKQGRFRLVVKKGRRKSWRA